MSFSTNTFNIAAGKRPAGVKSGKLNFADMKKRKTAAARNTSVMSSLMEDTQQSMDIAASG